MQSGNLAQFPVAFRTQLAAPNPNENNSSCTHCAWGCFSCFLSQHWVSLPCSHTYFSCLFFMPATQAFFPGLHPQVSVSFYLFLIGIYLLYTLTAFTNILLFRSTTCFVLSLQCSLLSPDDRTSTFMSHVRNHCKEMQCLQIRKTT